MVKKVDRATGCGKWLGFKIGHLPAAKALRGLSHADCPLVSAASAPSRLLAMCGAAVARRLAAAHGAPAPCAPGTGG